MSNVLLDELDKELERRGHKFCRFRTTGWLNHNQETYALLG